MEGAAVSSSGASSAKRWTSFRGADDTNVSHAARLPRFWSDDDVTWRSSAAGFGQSSPVIWGDVVFVTSIEGTMKETLWVTALSLEEGEVSWRRSFPASERHEWNDYVSKAAPSPAVDAERLYVFFASGDLHALNHEGDIDWSRNLVEDYGTVGGNHGVGNSVLLTDDAAVVLLTRRTYSYLLAVDRETGRRCGRRTVRPGWRGAPRFSPPAVERSSSAHPDGSRATPRRVASCCGSLPTTALAETTCRRRR